MLLIYGDELIICFCYLINWYWLVLLVVCCLLLVRLFTCFIGSCGVICLCFAVWSLRIACVIDLDLFVLVLLIFDSFPALVLFVNMFVCLFESISALRYALVWLVVLLCVFGFAFGCFACLFGLLGLLWVIQVIAWFA